MVHLYEAVDQYRVLQQAIEDGEIEEEDFALALSQLQGQIEDKAEGVAKFYLELQASTTAIRAEEDRLSRRRRNLDKKAYWLKDYLLRQLTDAGIDKVKRDLLTVSVRANPPSVDVIDLEAIPQVFRRVIPEAWAPDKNQIIDHWKATREQIPGVQIVSDKKSVVIK